jgi:hypothetical protein
MFEDIDPIFIVELAIILIIMVVQLVVFFRNLSSINKLKSLFPDASALNMEYHQGVSPRDEEAAQVAGPANKRVAILENNGSYSSIFQNIVESINQNLLKNSGKVKPGVYKEIAESRSNALIDQIETVIAMPLYIGLLGTFTGVIIGLLRIASQGVGTEAIQSFIGGVLIGMVASALGLLLTVLLNGAFKKAKTVKNYRLADLLQFLQLNMGTYGGSGSLGESTGFSAPELSRFASEMEGYHRNINQGIGSTITRFEELHSILGEIRNLEPALSSISHSMRSNTSQVEQQADGIRDLANQTQKLTNELESHLERVDGRLRTVIATHSSQLNAMEEGNYQSATAPATETPLQREMLARLNETEEHNRQTNAHLLNLQTTLQKAITELQTGDSGFTDTILFRLFTLSGIFAFIVVMVLGIIYFVNVVLPNYVG